MACGAPHIVAPDLVGWAGEGKMQHCFWKKQPETAAELGRAIAVLETQELGCHRNAGTDPAILDRILSTYCDYPMQSLSALHVEGKTDSLAPRFALLDDHPNVITRLLRAIVGRRKANPPVTPV
jgi:hypothetical protein